MSIKKTGRIITINDDIRQSTLMIETKEAIPGKPPQPAQRIIIMSNDDTILNGLKKGDSVTVIIQSEKK